MLKSPALRRIQAGPAAIDGAGLEALFLPIEAIEIQQR